VADTILRSREGLGRGEDHAGARPERLRGRQAPQARADQYLRLRPATLNDAVPKKYQGLERFAARKAVVADLEALGLVERSSRTAHAVPHAQRGNAVVEYWLTDQWYVNAAGARQAGNRRGRGPASTSFVPQNWEKTYFEWMRNIQPGPSRASSGGATRSPRGTGRTARHLSRSMRRAARAKATKHYKKDVELTRDEDVLDTWFSSGLWAFSTLGWPDDTKELNRFYPTSALVTGFDIIFFWVARMMMMSLFFMKEVPFRDVYIHALVRDEKGQKMSKSKGNVMDPLG
jgi:valyl-tRNA synthetase